MTRHIPPSLTVGALLDIIAVYCFVASVLQFISDYLNYREREEGR